ncbi:MAG: hypothetical protein QOG50_3399 [Actinomycetota bacterium]|jgi:hypothetical protein|nr:hypothetical protein [Actinomycetota bacterium]
MVVGAVVGIASIVAIAVPFVRTFTESAHSVPSQFSIHLRHARYTVFELTGSRSGFNFGTSPSGHITLEPSQVAVTAPDGQPVFVFHAVNSETLNRGSSEYTSAVQFDAPMSGGYDVRLSPRTPTWVIITRAPRDVIRSVLVWFATGAVGGIILVAGLVMLIVGVTRRGRARRATQVGWGQPQWGQPAWGAQYPPPQYGAQYPPAPYGPPPQYPPPQYPPPQYPAPPAAPDPPQDPWAPRPPQAKS